MSIFINACALRRFRRTGEPMVLILANSMRHGGTR
jgi:hypothetical protein